MKNTFTIIRSFLLVLTMYLAFILNNSFGQYFTSQFLLSTFLLTFILAELVSYAYKLVFANPPGLKLTLFFLALGPVLIYDFPLLLDDFIVFASLLLYIYTISLLAMVFSLEDQFADYNSDTVRGNSLFTLHERKGLIYSTYILKYTHPLVFLSTDDAQHFIDFLRSSNGQSSLSFTSECTFVLSAQGCRFFPTTVTRLYETALDLEKIALNLLIK